MTLEDLMLAFITDYPNGHLLLRHDPLRTVGQWTATAYRWRGDGDSPAGAIGKLRGVVVSNTISELPALPEGHEWVGLGASGQWQPEAPERIAWQREHNDGLLLFGEPPPLSVVRIVPDYRLYVPVKA